MIVAGCCRTLTEESIWNFFASALYFRLSTSGALSLTWVLGLEIATTPCIALACSFCGRLVLPAAQLLKLCRTLIEPGALTLTTVCAFVRLEDLAILCAVVVLPTTKVCWFCVRRLIIGLTLESRVSEDPRTICDSASNFLF